MKLLLAAERLFALHGPDGTSSRLIVAEAGQRNASALNYHFATREELIEAICRLRMEPINNDRIERVAEYLAQRPPPAERLRALVSIVYLPALIPITEANGKSYFRRFLAQAINNPTTKFVSIVRGRLDSGLRQTAPLMREEMRHLPADIADKRIATMIRAISYLSAHLEARSAEGPWPERKTEIAIETQLEIDGFVGFLHGAHTATKAAGKSIKTRTSNYRTSDLTWEKVLL